MIEQAIVEYLNTVTALTTLLGGQKIYYRRVPPLSGTATIKMPWVIVTNSGGRRTRDTQVSTEGRDTLTIYVEHNNPITGRAIAEAVLRALENYRGDMSPERDLDIRCGSVRDLDGFQGSFKFIVTAYIRYRQTTAFPS
jgi:hypothetical protein